MVDLIDVVLEGIKGVVDWFIGLFMNGLRSGYETLTEGMFGTPTPETNGAFVFGEPTNAPWPAIHDALIGGEIMLVALLLLVMSVQGRHTVRIFNIGSAYEARKPRRQPGVGAFLIITWYWIGTLALYLVDGFTIALMPELSSVASAMIQFLGAAITNPGLGLLFAVIGGISMWALEALFYIRMILLYVSTCTECRLHLHWPMETFQSYPISRWGSANGLSRWLSSHSPAAMVLKGYDLIYAGGDAHARNSVPQNISSLRPPTGRTLHHVEDVQIRDPVDGQSRRRCDERRSPCWRCRRRGLRRWRRRRDDRRSVGPESRRWPRRRAKAAARGGHGADDSGTPSYRRTENDPGGATAESTSDGRGMDFDRGIH